jgi:UDP-glucose 6-dehydrogenase
VVFDIEHPDSNVIGIPLENSLYLEKANLVLSILPSAPNIICKSVEAELMKYAHNVHGFVEIMYTNMLYDLSSKLGINWERMKEFISHDRFMVSRYASPLHASGHTEKAGRGAGGHCYIKDFKAFREVFEKIVGDKKSLAILGSLEEKNIELLTESGKDLELLQEVYGGAQIKK